MDLLTVGTHLSIQYIYNFFYFNNSTTRSLTSYIEFLFDLHFLQILALDLLGITDTMNISLPFIS